MDLSPHLLSYLASVTLRSLGLVTAAGLAILIFRIKTAAARHAVWTVVAGGMLLLLFAPALPQLPLRLLKSAPAAAFVPLPDLPVATAELPIVTPQAPPARRFTWQDFAIAVYALGVLGFFARLVFGYLFTLRLVHAARPIDRPWASGVRASSWISVPMTAGCIRPRILLPDGWENWSDSKLQAVLAHERTHIARADWAIALLAGVNRCIFWFHPQAWWIERTLASLAEHACDDSALLLVGSAPYAQALLDMAAAVRTAQGRLLWEAMAMSKAAEVRHRIERILDETRQIPRGLTRARWAALLLCSLPLIYFVSVAQLAPAAAQDVPRTPEAMNDYLKGKRQFTAADVATMEQYLVTNPQDIDVRGQLINYYYFGPQGRQPRLNHIFWLIQNHPESNPAIFNSMGLTPQSSAQNDAADFARAVELWKQAAMAHSHDPQALANAAQFLSSRAGEWDAAERLLQSARNVQPTNPTWTEKLARLYIAAILGASGDPAYPTVDSGYASRVRSTLESSTDGFLMFSVGSPLTSVAARPTEMPIRPPMLNLDDHPQLVPVIDLGERLLRRAGEFGGPITRVAQRPPVQEQQLRVTRPPVLIRKVDPLYPVLAVQAHLEGVVRLRATIGTDGSIKQLDVMSGPAMLAQAATEAISQWRFNPALQDNQPVEMTATMIVPFMLDGHRYDPAYDPSAEPTKGPVFLTTAYHPTDASVPTRIRVGGNVQAAKLLEKVEPVYPPLARVARLDGDVKLQVTIDPDGHVEKAEPVEGDPLLAAAAVEAVKQWTYKPTLLNGQPVSVVTQVTIPFHL